MPSVAAASQELYGLHSWQEQEYKGFHSFQRLCFEKRILGAPANPGLPREVFPGIQLPGYLREQGSHGLRRPSYCSRGWQTLAQSL
jgi:hypothetical protein